MANKSQVDINFEAFQKELPNIIGSYAGKIAVMKDGKIVEFFDSVNDAVRFGHAKFGGEFSIQEVTNKNINLGFHSHAVFELQQ